MALRKKPLAHPSQLDDTIDNYVMKLLLSPVRLQNPNLRPLDDQHATDTSLSIGRQAGGHDHQSGNPGGDPKGNHAFLVASSPQNSASSNGKSFSNSLNSNPNSVNSNPSHSEPPSSQNTASDPPKLRRSTTFRQKLRSPLVKSTSVNDVSAKKRFLLNSSLSRLSLSARSSPSRTTPEDPIDTRSIASRGHNADSHSIFASDSENGAYDRPVLGDAPPFWKYHVLRFGKDLYLTTNPGLKHIYCRNGPSYYVEVVHAGKKMAAKNGYTLIFKELDGVEKNDSRPPIMMIYKKPEHEGGHYTLLIPQRSRLVQDSIQYSPEPHSLFHGIVFPKGIDSSYIPYDRISNAGRYQDLRNYEFKDCKNSNWNVGAIPRLRASTLNRLKNRVVSEPDDEDESLRLFGPRNVYFHQNYIDSAKQRSSDADYLQNVSNEFPPVLAMFRPLETKMRKKLLKRLNRMLQSRFTRSVELPAFAGQDTKAFHTVGDGLYYHANPVDDEPNDNKLGWLTIYEDRELFADQKYRGMFDIVLGLTLAVGFESQMEQESERKREKE